MIVRAAHPVPRQSTQVACKAPHVGIPATYEGVGIRRRAVYLLEPAWPTTFSNERKVVGNSFQRLSVVVDDIDRPR